MQAIHTKYHGPTNHRSSHVTAIAAAGRISVPYDQGTSVEANHVTAAEALRAKFNWNREHYGHLVSGTLKDGSFVHVTMGKE